MKATVGYTPALGMIEVMMCRTIETVLATTILYYTIPYYKILLIIEETYHTNIPTIPLPCTGSIKGW